MITIDAHQHFWNYHPHTHAWIGEDMKVIRKNFLPQDLQPVLTANNIDGCIAVQADQSEKETNFLLSLAAQNNFIKGVIGWVNLSAANIEQQLDAYGTTPLLKGFRHILQSEEPAFMLQPAFVNGIKALQKHGFTYDILIFPKHFAAAQQLVQQFPKQPFVIDHMAKPYIKDGLIDEWKRDMKSIAQYENVYCKISGMVTEANHTGWAQADFIPYLDAVTEAFGTKRIMFGSDWPVCLLAASYQQMLQIVQKYFASFSLTEQQQFFAGNAKTFYHL